MIKRLLGKGKIKLAYLVALVVSLVASTTINVSHSEAGGGY